MARQMGPASLVTRFNERLPEIAQQLPQMPDLLATANYEIKRLGHLGNQQAAAIAELRDEQDARTRRTRRYRKVGAGLAVAFVVLWLFAHN